MMKCLGSAAAEGAGEILGGVEALQSGPNGEYAGRACAIHPLLSRRAIAGIDRVASADERR